MKREVNTGRISVYQFLHSFLYGKILVGRRLLTKILPYKGIHNKNKLNGQSFLMNRYYILRFQFRIARTSSTKHIVYRITSGTGDIHEHKTHKINQCKFFCRHRIRGMYHKEGNRHIYNHWNHRQTIKESEHKCHRAD